MTKQIVVVDIDGTIANDRERANKWLTDETYMQFDTDRWDGYYSECSLDKPIQPIIDLVKTLSKTYRIIFCTGRRESCRKDTVRWLLEAGLITPGVNEGTLILMRPDGNHEKDWTLKPKLLEEFFIKKEDVAFILEDRNRMVKKWRELGFTCLQVADGDF